MDHFKAANFIQKPLRYKNKQIIKNRFEEVDLPDFDPSLAEVREAKNQLGFLLRQQFPVI